jgi:hypothetical protein
VVSCRQSNPSSPQTLETKMFEDLSAGSIARLVAKTHRFGIRNACWVQIKYNDSQLARRPW